MQYVSEMSVKNVSKNKGASVMSKKGRSKKAIAYKMTKKQSVLAESCGKSIIAGYKEFAELAKALTGYKPMVTITKGKGKSKKTTAKAIVWTERYAKAMKRLKATVKPVWLKCGMTIRQVNVRFSQYIKAVYGTSMQKQVKTAETFEGVDDAEEYTVNLKLESWKKNFRDMLRNMVDAGLSKDVSAIYFDVVQ